MRLLIASAIAVLVLSLGVVGTAQGAGKFRNCGFAGAGSSASDVRAKHVSCRKARRLARKHGQRCGATPVCKLGKWTCKARTVGATTKVRCKYRRKVVKFKYEPQG